MSPKQTFRFKQGARWNQSTSLGAAHTYLPIYTTNITYTLHAPGLNKSTLFAGYKGTDASTIAYSMSFVEPAQAPSRGRGPPAIFSLTRLAGCWLSPRHPATTEAR